MITKSKLFNKTVRSVDFLYTRIAVAIANSILAKSFFNRSLVLEIDLTIFHFVPAVLLIVLSCTQTSRD